MRYGGWTTSCAFFQPVKLAAERQRAGFQPIPSRLQLVDRLKAELVVYNSLELTPLQEKDSSAHFSKSEANNTT